MFFLTLVITFTIFHVTILIISMRMWILLITGIDSGNDATNIESFENMCDQRTDCFKGEASASKLWIHHIANHSVLVVNALKSESALTNNFSGFLQFPFEYFRVSMLGKFWNSL